MKSIEITGKEVRELSLEEIKEKVKKALESTPTK